MSESARRLLFGISVTPYADAYPSIVEQVLAADRAGLDVVGIQDHPYQRRFLDTFTLIADLLARTSRLRFFPDVASLPMRPPAMAIGYGAAADVLAGRPLPTDLDEAAARMVTESEMVQAGSVLLAKAMACDVDAVERGLAA